MASSGDMIEIMIGPIVIPVAKHDTAYTCISLSLSSLSPCLPLPPKKHPHHTTTIKQRLNSNVTMIYYPTLFLHKKAVSKKTPKTPKLKQIPI